MKTPDLRALFPILLFWAAGFVAGCATFPDLPGSSISFSGKEEEKKARDPFRGLADQYRLRARELEKTGDLPRARKAWAVVRSFSPDDAESRERIAHLEKEISGAADGHFRRGVELFKNHSPAPARKELLAALYLKPDHDGALHFLKEKLAGEDFLAYEVKKGDTIREVSQKVYEDPAKDFLIAYFNGLTVDSPIEPQQRLKLPILESLHLSQKPAAAGAGADPKAKKTGDIKGHSAKGKSSLASKNLPESAAPPEKIRENGSENRETREVFQRGDGGYNDDGVQDALNPKEIAENHYINGVKFFAQDELERAIMEWETALALEPSHPKAKKDIESARNLLRKLEKIK